MPNYDYYCEHNQEVVEVFHGINESVTTWGRVCDLTGREPGDTPLEAPVRKLVAAPGLAFPKTNAELKNLGFTKLVKREKGVYENVTAQEGEKRYMKADDPSSTPNFSNRIGD